MPNQPKTPIRGVRIPDELWQQVKQRAQREGTTASAVVNELLAEWLRSERHGREV